MTLHIITEILYRHGDKIELSGLYYHNKSQAMVFVALVVGLQGP